MKKLKLDTAKLQLNKEKIADLTNEEMGVVNGGTRTFTTSVSILCTIKITVLTIKLSADGTCVSKESCFQSCGCPATTNCA
ncbi:class I lanthipeptide [Taibaiella helva]|uniref:class I lanthipeptide n=1 Tax=Taibaiella helva TaxID=2301235 RepID=UPI0013001E96|nr:class I lanthipeptide [Taibaiella helva]